MEEKIFEIKVIEDYNKPQKQIFFGSIIIWLIIFLLSILYFKKGVRAFDYIALSFYFLIFLIHFLKKAYPKWILFRTFIHFKEDLFSYKLSTFKGEQSIHYSDIKQIRILESNIFIEINGEEIKLRLGVFSSKLIHRIKLQFNDLRKEFSSN